MKSLINNLVRTKLCFWIPAIVAIVADLWTKSWAQERLTSAVSDLNPNVTFFFEKATVPLEGQTLIDGVLNLKWAENTGAAFSIGSGQTELLLFLGVGVMGLMLMYVYRLNKKRWITLVCLGLIAGGAVGNLYDRVTYSAPNQAELAAYREGKIETVSAVPAVRDFFNFPFRIPVFSTAFRSQEEIDAGWLRPYPIFNVADCLIMGGVVILVGILLFTKEEEKDKLSEGKEPPVMAEGA